MRLWATIARASWKRINDDNLSVLSAGVAFYAFLSIFPAIAGGLMVWGLFAKPGDIGKSIAFLRSVAPPDALNLIADQMVRIATAPGGGLTLGVALSFAFAIWSASRAAVALMAVIDVAYKVRVRRGLIAMNLAAIEFTTVGIAFALLSIAAIGAVPPILDALRLGAFVKAIVNAGRWLFLIGLFFALAAAIYRFAPSGRRRRRDRDEMQERRPALPGAFAASVIWLAASAAFSLYLSEFQSYNKTFGSLGAVAALLMWLWISAYAIGVGAEVNAELTAAIRGPRASSRSTGPRVTAAERSAANRAD